MYDQPPRINTQEREWPGLIVAKFIFNRAVMSPCKSAPAGKYSMANPLIIMIPEHCRPPRPAQLETGKSAKDIGCYTGGGNLRQITYVNIWFPVHIVLIINLALHVEISAEDLQSQTLTINFILYQWNDKFHLIMILPLPSVAENQEKDFRKDFPRKGQGSPGTF